VKIKKPSKLDIVIIIVLIIILIVTTHYYNQRGFFLGFILIYFYGLKDVIVQLPEIAKQSKKKAYFLSIYFTIVTLILFTILYKYIL